MRILLAALAIAMLSGASAAPTHAVLRGTITRDGAIVIEGARYSDGARLKAELAAIHRRHPVPVLTFVVEPGADMNAVGHAAVLLEAAGLRKFGFLTEPSSP